MGDQSKCLNCHKRTPVARTSSLLINPSSLKPRRDRSRLVHFYVRSTQGDPVRLEVVFYTNQDRFQIGKDVFIYPEDVDLQGCLRTSEKLKEILKALGVKLRQGVGLRFFILPGTS